MSEFQKKFANDETGRISPTIQGLFVSSILITASLSSIVSGPLSDRISRTRTVSLGGFVFAAGSAIACSAQSLAQLFVGRSIAGLGEGLFLSAITVYAVEIAPASIRGRLGSVIQLLITIGIATGYFVCFGTSHIPSSLSWRFPLGMQAVAATMLAVISPLLPHSPRWLRHVGRTAEADATWIKLGVSAADAQKSEESSNCVETKRIGLWKGVKQLWGKDVRKRSALGIFLMGMQQTSGIDGVLYYAPVIFSQAGLPGTTASFIASGVSGLVNVACAIVTQVYADAWGRRPAMIWGGSVIAGSMLTIGALYASNASETQAGRVFIIVLIYVFIIGFCCSWAINTRIICSEIQPMKTRAVVTSLGQCTNWLVNWIITFSTPLLLARSPSSLYFLFGACSLLTTLVCLAFLPETRGASLEEVDKAFETSPWKQALEAHQLIAHSQSQRGFHIEQDAEVDLKEDSEDGFSADVIVLPRV